jgi:hypothetical protein
MCSMGASVAPVFISRMKAVRSSANSGWLLPDGGLQSPGHGWKIGWPERPWRSFERQADRLSGALFA